MPSELPSGARRAGGRSATNTSLRKQCARQRGARVCFATDAGGSHEDLRLARSAALPILNADGRTVPLRNSYGPTDRPPREILPRDAPAGQLHATRMDVPVVARSGDGRERN